MKKVLIVAYHFPPQAESSGYLRASLLWILSGIYPSEVDTCGRWRYPTAG
jgi:hypothetical protein